MFHRVVVNKSHGPYRNISSKMVEISTYIDENLDCLFTCCLIFNYTVRGELPGRFPYTQPKELLQHDEKTW